MKKIYTGNSGYSDVFEGDDGTYYLLILCGGIAWGHVGIVMNEEEKSAFARDPKSIDLVARSMCNDFAPFRGREIPEAIRSSLI